VPQLLKENSAAWLACCIFAVMSFTKMRGEIVLTPLVAIFICVLDFVFRKNAKNVISAFLPRDSYAKRGICRRRVSVYHTPVLYQNG